MLQYIGQSAAKFKVMFHVYRLRNTVNNKSYIGITSRAVSKRWEEHQSRARNDARNSRIYAAMKKYGNSKFEVETLASTDCEDRVREMEGEYIALYDSYENGYNCNLGGHGFLVVPEEIRRKISEAQKGKAISKESRKKMSEAKLGDPSCAKHLGNYTKSGRENPKAKSYLVEFPDGHVEIITGLRAFRRKYGIYLSIQRKNSMGFKLLKTFNDYPEGEYSQAAGKGAAPEMEQDIV